MQNIKIFTNPVFTEGGGWPGMVGMESGLEGKNLMVRP